MAHQHNNYKESVKILSLAHQQLVDQQVENYYNDCRRNIMDLRKEVEEFEKLEGTDIMNAMVVNGLMNNYTLENVAFGKLRPNDEIPFNRYVEELDLYKFKPHSYWGMVEENYITRDGKVAKKSEEDFIMECYLFHIQNVIMAYPKCSIVFGKDDFGLSKFIMSLYPLFKQIIKTEVEVEPSALAPAFKDRKDETDCYDRISKFLIAIKARGLRQGECVSRYLHTIFCSNTFKSRKNRYLLANSDTSSLDYKLAILSAIHFMNFKHTKLFELKAQRWERTNQ